MLVFLFIVASASLALPITNAAADCSVCGLTNSFNESNGYYCFVLNNETVACTCPDQRYKLNQPCRICARPDICGNNPNSYCVETSSTSFVVETNSTKYFACFCDDSTFVIGGACPSLPTTTATDAPAKENSTNSFA